jgi:hypothetical protein
MLYHEIWDVIHSYKMSTPDVEFEIPEKEKSHGISSGEYVGCGNTGLPLLVKHSFTELAV